VSEAQRKKTVTHNSVLAAHRLKNAGRPLMPGIFSAQRKDRAVAFAKADGLVDIPPGRLDFNASTTHLLTFLVFVYFPASLTL
jgi:hypothetical protein